MTQKKTPETVSDLLLLLEKEGNLRSLARECGITASDLKRQLRKWRRELGSTTVKTSNKKTKSIKENDLPLAELTANPMPKKGSDVMEIWTDGASRGNPGAASIGMVFGQQDSVLLCAWGEVIPNCTNNVAEYTAVIRALEYAVNWGIDKISLRIDSELVARQLTGQYRVKSEDLIPLYRQIISLSRKLKLFQVKHIRREENSHADLMANLALDGKLGN
jgi:ribonuclease HI